MSISGEKTQIQLNPFLVVNTKAYLLTMFAAIASGNPLQLSTEVPNSGGLQHMITLSSTISKSYSHITLFILPSVTFPHDYLATIYFKLSPNEDFKLFGYLSTEKPSAIFKVKLPNPGALQSFNYEDGLGEVDMEDTIGNDDNPTNNASELMIGISIEPRQQALVELKEWKDRQKVQNKGAMIVSKVNSMPSIVTPGQLSKFYPALVEQMASKIVQHAYNYLTGFLDERGNVSIKRFDTWWEKFKKKMSNDNSFLDEITSN